MKEVADKIIKIGTKPVKLLCVHCNTTVKTKLQHEASMMTHSAAIMLLP